MSASPAEHTPASGPARPTWLARLKGLKGAIVAVAGVGAVLSGLVGYYTTYKTVAGAPTQTATVPSISSDPSIAVLPFLNMSEDKSNEYFSDGISEELLNLLAKVPKLRVISRTSSFSFKGKDVPIAEIARKLHVAAVLEGSVRKSGNKVRITVQLTRAADSSQLWSHTFDRTLDDIFKVQDEISAAVVGELKVTMLGGAPKAKAMDPQAYALILRARYFLLQSSSSSKKQAIALYKQALAIAPDAQAAWHGLANAYLSQGAFGDLSTVESFQLARDAVNQALASDPNNAESESLLAVIAENVGDLPGASRHFQRALAIDPGDVDAVLQAATFLARLKQIDDGQALAILERQFAKDPVNARLARMLGRAYFFTGKWEQAHSTFELALSISPDMSAIHAQHSHALLAKGDVQAALAEAQREPDELWRLVGLAMAYDAQGRKAEASEALAKVIKANDASPGWDFNIAYAMAYRGDKTGAFAYLDRSVATQDAGMPAVLVEPFLANLHDDPRWTVFLRKVGRAPEQAAALAFKLPAQAPAP